MDQTSNLPTWLQGIDEAEKEGNYDKRNVLIYAALSTATDEGLPAGVRLDPNEPEWPVVFIELPTGQVSWHVPQHTTPWDGHSTEEKYRRLRQFVESEKP